MCSYRESFYLVAMPRNASVPEATCCEAWAHLTMSVSLWWHQATGTTPSSVSGKGLFHYNSTHDTRGMGPASPSLGAFSSGWRPLQGGSFFSHLTSPSYLDLGAEGRPTSSGVPLIRCSRAVS